MLKKILTNSPCYRFFICCLFVHMMKPKNILCNFDTLRAVSYCVRMTQSIVYFGHNENVYDGHNVLRTLDTMAIGKI